MDNFINTNADAKKIVVKAADFGTVETIKSQIDLIKCPEGNRYFEVLRYEMGGITETDLIDCLEFDASIYCMDVKPIGNIESMANEERISIKSYNIIYKLIEDLKALNDELAPDAYTGIDIKGHAVVKQIFEINLNQTTKLKIAGFQCNEGYLKKSLSFRVMRNGTVLEDNLETVSLRKFKKEVKEVKMGNEGGISFKQNIEVHAGDVIECYV